MSLEGISVVGSVVVGGLGAATGIVSVVLGSKTQLETIRRTADAQVAQQRQERLAAWRRERYGELLAAVGEFYAAVRSLNLAQNALTRGLLAEGDLGEKARARYAAAREHYHEIDASGRILAASVQVADGDLAAMAQKIADIYRSASFTLLAVDVIFSVRHGGGDADRRANLERAEARAREQLAQAKDLTHELNRRIEHLISAGE